MNKNKDQYDKYFDILELPRDSSLQEIRKVYNHLIELYSGESIATLPVDEEMSEERRKEIIEEINIAYEELLALFKQDNIRNGKDVSEILSDINIYDGNTLQQIRKRLKIELHDIALETKIPIRYLEDIEEENFSALPPAVYTRGFVINYARYLKLDQKKVAEDYMEKYRKWKSEQIQ